MILQALRSAKLKVSSFMILQTLKLINEGAEQNIPDISQLKTKSVDMNDSTSLKTG